MVNGKFYKRRERGRMRDKLCIGDKNRKMVIENNNDKKKTQ